MSRAIPDYDAGNRVSAGIILADPERYGPGMVAWAELWRSRHQAAPAQGERQPKTGQMVFEWERKAA